MRVPPFDALLSTLQTKFSGHSNILAWLDEIPETKIDLLKELDDLPNDQTMYGHLDGDLGNVPALKNEFLSNDKLIEAWEDLQTIEIARTNIEFLKTTSKWVQDQIELYSPPRFSTCKYKYRKLFLCVLKISNIIKLPIRSVISFHFCNDDFIKFNSELEMFFNKKSQE